MVAMAIEYLLWELAKLIRQAPVRYSINGAKFYYCLRDKIQSSNRCAQLQIIGWSAPGYRPAGLDGWWRSYDWLELQSAATAMMPEPCGRLSEMAKTLVQIHPTLPLNSSNYNCTLQPFSYQICHNSHQQSKCLHSQCNVKEMLQPDWPTGSNTRSGSHNNGLPVLYYWWFRPQKPLI